MTVLPPMFERLCSIEIDMLKINATYKHVTYLADDGGDCQCLERAAPKEHFPGMNRLLHVEVAQVDILQTAASAEHRIKFGTLTGVEMGNVQGGEVAAILEHVVEPFRFRGVEESIIFPHLPK